MLKMWAPHKNNNLSTDAVCLESTDDTNKNCHKRVIEVSTAKTESVLSSERVNQRAQLKRKKEIQQLEN
ncbi:hypothetical protein [Colwellia sp. 75C3]|uniref:hypothetical protein n=1 Tax=Colwellia sp. 75C3 TaxID=888425 RepID=UPI0012FEBF9A|nr:hypothetical protein [Colwellia sp. 75C3]